MTHKDNSFFGLAAFLVCGGGDGGCGDSGGGVCVCFVVVFFSGTGELCAFVCLSTSDGECA